MKNRNSAELAQALRFEMARDAILTTAQARLYSQAVRLGWGGVGLPSWQAHEVRIMLDDALRIIEAGRILSEEGSNSDARACFRRAGELLEWLDRIARVASDEVTDSVPLSLLAAGSYQLAGLPAMASGLWGRENKEGGGHTLFAAFLKADFRSVRIWTTNYWMANLGFTSPSSAFQSPESHCAIELIRAVGLFSLALERNDRDRLILARRKLDQLALYAARAAEPYTWLTISIASEVAAKYERSSLWSGVDPLRAGLSIAGSKFLSVFVRNLFREGRGLLWPSQEQGVNRLASGKSFAMCTPTGSGKTTVAELALLQALFVPVAGSESVHPLVIYLVPSRALAAETETRLETDLKSAVPNLIITGLYGGAEWSLADAWLTADEPTVLVSTVEMADSLLRLTGPLLIPRVRLLIVDEAHQVQFSTASDAVEQLRRAEDRSARLEQFCARIFTNVPACRAVALSAVAGGAENNIARWFARDDAESALGTKYRSTRQLIGVLGCHADGSTIISLEIVDGQWLRLADRNSEAYIPAPVPARPKVTGIFQTDIGAFIRAHVCWVAVSLAHAGRNVLISIVSQLNATLAQLRELFEKQTKWIESLPAFFLPPSEGQAALVYKDCLMACEDYCGPDSYEAFFLRRGISVHHGQLPVRVRRLMNDVIRNRITSICIATSTLTEGVNLPFDVVIVPSIVRRAGPPEASRWEVISAGEFSNLAGRAGRPGNGVEGITLVAQPLEPTSKKGSKARKAQESRIRLDSKRVTQLLQSIFAGQTAADARSPLAQLLRTIRELWQRLTMSGDDASFMKWLETAVPEGGNLERDTDPSGQLSEALDALDLVLLSAVEEAERLRRSPLSGAELEDHIRRLWSHTYAKFSAANAAELESYFIVRGVAIPTRIYPEPERRRALYQLGLPPAYGKGFQNLADRIEGELRGALGFADWSLENRFSLLERIGRLLETEPRFKFRKIPNGVHWQDMLRWWVQAPSAAHPDTKNVRDWLRVGTAEFEFRLGIAISATISSVWNKAKKDDFEVPTLNTWRLLTGLPWAAFWLRELLGWGTLQPTIALVIAGGKAPTRLAATTAVEAYERWWNEREELDREDFFNPNKMRLWFNSQAASGTRDDRSNERSLVVSLTRPPGPGTPESISVLPSLVGDRIFWLDGAGYHLATSELSNLSTRDSFVRDEYVLVAEKSTVEKAHK